VMVLEGLPVAGREDPYAFAKVLEVHDGELVAIPQSTTKCKIEDS